MKCLSLLLVTKSWILLINSTVVGCFHSKFKKILNFSKLEKIKMNYLPHLMPQIPWIPSTGPFEGCEDLRLTRLPPGSSDSSWKHGGQWQRFVGSGGGSKRHSAFVPSKSDSGRASKLVAGQGRAMAGTAGPLQAQEERFGEERGDLGTGGLRRQSWNGAQCALQKRKCFSTNNKPLFCILWL